MHLLIDGYNLLHKSPLMQRKRGRDWLQQARQRLLQFLSDHLGPDSLAQTTVVFDAQQSPTRAGTQSHFGPIRVLYAAADLQADDLIEQLIRQHPTPKKLQVVSSDRRIQDCARANRATAWDSEAWLARLVREPNTEDQIESDRLDAIWTEIKSEGPMSASSEVARWLHVFLSNAPIESAVIPTKAIKKKSSSSSTDQPKREKSNSKPKAKPLHERKSSTPEDRKRARRKLGEQKNPFPPEHLND